MKTVAMAACLVLMACAGGADRSPRERTEDLALRFEAVQVVAAQVVASPLVSLEVRQGIAIASRAALEAVKAFDRATRGCVRDPATGEILFTPTLGLCQQDTASLALGPARAAIGALILELTRNGFVVQAGGGITLGG